MSHQNNKREHESVSSLWTSAAPDRSHLALGVPCTGGRMVCNVKSGLGALHPVWCSPAAGVHRCLWGSWVSTSPPFWEPTVMGTWHVHSGGEPGRCWLCSWKATGQGCQSALHWPRSLLVLTEMWHLVRSGDLGFWENATVWEKGVNRGSSKVATQTGYCKDILPGMAHLSPTRMLKCWCKKIHTRAKSPSQKEVACCAHCQNPVWCRATVCHTMLFINSDKWSQGAGWPLPLLLPPLCFSTPSSTLFQK